MVLPAQRWWISRFQPVGPLEGELRRRKGVELEPGESDAVYAIEGGGTAAEG